MRTLVALVILSVPASAGAQVTSRWALAEGCPTEAEATARAGSALAGAPEASLDVAIESLPDGYRAQLALTGAVQAQRALSDPDCAALVDATIVIAALALGLDPSAPEPVIAPPAPGAPEPEAPPEPPPEPPMIGRERSSPALELRVAAGATLETSLASVPLAISATVGLAYDALRIEAGARAWPSMDASPGPGEGAALWAAVGSLGAGVGAWLLEFDAGRLELAGRGRVELGVLHGAGYGVALPQSDDALLLALGADVGLTWWPVSFLGVELVAGLTVPLIRPRFVLDGAPVFRPDPAGLRLELRLLASFGEIL